MSIPSPNGQLRSVTVLCAALGMLTALDSAQARRRLPPTWTSTPHRLRPTTAPSAAPPRRTLKTPAAAPPRRGRAKVSRKRCLLELSRTGVKFRVEPKRRLVWQPVRILAPIHGVSYEPMWRKHPPLVDCQFALGLYRAAPVFAKLGVAKVRYSNTWRPAPRRRWRSMGHHPRGMAMDVHEYVLKDGTKVDVLKDWEKLYGGPGNCVGRPKTKKGALLRRIACALERAHVFYTILTPDSDRAHRDHFHISGAAFGRAFTRRRWAGRYLLQPLPGKPGFKGYYYYYSCWKFRSTRRRRRCYRRRRKYRRFAPIKYSWPKQIPRVAIWLFSAKRPAATKAPAKPSAPRKPLLTRHNRGK